MSIFNEFRFVLLQLGFGALAALKKKRKKFSKSRNTSPILEPATRKATDNSAVSSLL